ncbi:HAMP domain-containing histidine kinase, partial [Pseudomonas syringae]
RATGALDRGSAGPTAPFADGVGRSGDSVRATLGQDLRAPLRAVRMSPELLAGRIALDEKTQSYVSRIQTSTRHMGSMVSALLEFVRSRLGAGLPVERKYTDLASACRDAIEEACAGRPDSVPVLNIEGNTKGHWGAGRSSQMSPTANRNAP